MQIILDGLGKKFNKTWIFKDVRTRFEANKAYAILGANGSGKSTLLQVIACFLTPSAGSVRYVENNADVLIDDVYKRIAVSTPYMELIEEFTLMEMLDFHSVMKPFRHPLKPTDLIEITGLGASAHKQIKYFSSGMKQRVRLVLALLTDVPVVFLDEPTTNLDEQGVRWYNDLVQQHRKDRILVVCSNHIQSEYGFCDEVFDLSKHKENLS